jgi:hypothetical protein
MKKTLLLLILYSLAGAASWADPSEPPPPPSLPSGADLMPPATDQSTAMPGGNSDSTAAPPAAALKALDQAQPAPAATGKTSPSSDSLDTGVVQPPPVPEVPEKAKTKAVRPTPTSIPAPSPTPAKVAPLKNMTLSTGAGHAVADSGTEGGGTLSDYFPATEGLKWSYGYMDGGTKTRQVQCSSQKSMPNGTTRVVLEVTEGSLQFRERYSLYDNKVEHTATADKLFKGHFAFKLPGAGESAQWSQSLSGGVVKNFKASFGTGNGREKAYPDCLVVVEKSSKAKKAGLIVISYYAKGIGLAAVETYTPDMKLIPEKSYILSGASAEASQ